MEMVLKRNENSEAVSPVVGVMLMLVVTIIIAAVVSGFAGGLSGNTQTAPNMAMDVKISSSDNTMTFEQLSGDRVPTKDLQIITYYTYNNGTIIKMVNDANAESAHFDYSYGETVLPFLNDMIKTGGSTNPASHFGNYTLSAGDIMSVQGHYQEVYPDGPKDFALTQFLGFEVSEGDVVDVKVMHTPSDKYVYDKEVIVI